MRWLIDTQLNTEKIMYFMYFCHMFKISNGSINSHRYMYSIIFNELILEMKSEKLIWKILVDFGEILSALTKIIDKRNWAQIKFGFKVHKKFSTNFSFHWKLSQGALIVEMRVYRLFLADEEESLNICFHQSYWQVCRISFKI